MAGLPPQGDAGGVGTSRDDEGGAGPALVAPVASAVLTPAGAPQRRPTGWWVAPMYLAMSLVLLPWTAVLIRTLPTHAMSHNYRLAWVGFDVLLMLSMGRTAWLAWRRSPFVVNIASVTAALLVVDAWFDVTTAPTGGMLQACVLALFVEMPAAVLSLVIAGRAQVQIARTGVMAPPSRLRRAWRRRASGQHVAGGEAGPGERSEHGDVAALQDGVGHEGVPADR